MEYLNVDDEPPHRVENYRLRAILTLFCFTLTGVMALLYSLYVDRCLKRREFDDAQEASLQALAWSQVSFVMGAITNAIAFLVGVTVGVG